MEGSVGGQDDAPAGRAGRGFLGGRQARTAVKRQLLRLALPAVLALVWLGCSHHDNPTVAARYEALRLLPFEADALLSLDLAGIRHSALWNANAVYFERVLSPGDSLAGSQAEANSSTVDSIVLALSSRDSKYAIILTKASFDEDSVVRKVRRN